MNIEIYFIQRRPVFYVSYVGVLSGIVHKIMFNAPMVLNLVISSLYSNRMLLLGNFTEYVDHTLV